MTTPPRARKPSRRDGDTPREEPWVLAFRHAPVAMPGICYGQLDVTPVMPADEAAHAIEQALGDLRPERIWSSPLSRCAGPAQVLARRLSLLCDVDDRLREIAYGAWEGRAWAGIEREDARAHAEWRKSWQVIGPPRGESASDVERRVRAFWEELDRSVSHVIIGHAGVITALRVIVRGATWQDAMGEPVPHLAAERFTLWRSEER